jgi:hypothetical protein
VDEDIALERALLTSGLGAAVTIAGGGGGGGTGGGGGGGGARASAGTTVVPVIDMTLPDAELAAALWEAATTG